MRRAIAYIRVSTRRQANSQFGYRAQEAAIREFARLRQFRVIKTVREAKSAVDDDSLAERPALKAAIDEARERKVPILVHRLDRISRSSDELQRLVSESGVQFITCDGRGTEDPVVVKVEAARIAKETQMSSERTRAGLERAKAAGKRLGNRTNLREAQQKGTAMSQQAADLRRRELAAIIAEVKGSGHTTAVEIAKELNRRNLRTAQGREWSVPNLQRELRAIEAAQAKADLEARSRENPHWGTF